MAAPSMMSIRPSSSLSFSLRGCLGGRRNRVTTPSCSLPPPPRSSGNSNSSGANSGNGKKKNTKRTAPGGQLEASSQQPRRAASSPSTSSVASPPAPASQQSSMPRMPRAQTQNAQQPASLTRNSQTMPPPTQQQQQQQQQQQRQPAAQPTPEPNNTTAALVPRRNRRGDGTKRSSARLLCTQLVGKDVIARASGTRLGNVSALFVDTEAWRVKALDLRRDVLSGERATVMLPSLRQVGDVALVNDASAAVGAGSGAANSALYGLQSLIGCEVVTDDGYPLGKVSDFVFDPASGDVLSIRYNSVGVSWLPTGAVSTYEISEEELSHYAIPKTVVVRAMADSRAEQLTVGLLGRLGLEGSVWEEEEAEAVAAAMQMQQRQQRQLAATSSYRPAPQRYDYDAYAQQQQQQQQMAAPAPPPPQQEQARAPPAPPRPSASEWFADDGGNGMRELEEIYAEEQMYGSEQPPPPTQQRPPRR